MQKFEHRTNCNRKQSGPLTADELEELSAGGRVAHFAPAGPFPVSDLVAGDLSVLAAQGWRLPAKHDALQRWGRVVVGIEKHAKLNTGDGGHTWER